MINLVTEFVICCNISRDSPGVLSATTSGSFPVPTGVSLSSVW